MTTQDILELAARCEAATGPDRELDGAIDRLFHDRPKNGDYCHIEQAFWRVDETSGLLETPSGWARNSFCAARYTASLDAAMTLVPEGWERFDVDATAPELGIDWTLHGRKQEVTATAAAPALALTAASLKARAHTKGEK